jgi:hypothetical protein
MSKKKRIILASLVSTVIATLLKVYLDVDIPVESIMDLL